MVRAGMKEASALSPTPSRDMKKPLLERLGLEYLRRKSQALPRVDATDSISLLNPEERKALARIVRGAVARAALAGALSAAVSAAAEVVADHFFTAEHGGVDNKLFYWALVGGVTALAAIAEIVYLYWDSLEAVHDMSRAAGLDPFATSDDQTAVAAALARAALELPNPTDHAFGVDPRREASKLRLAVASLLYKVKVSVTNFLLKVVVRRIAGRALVRTWLPFVAVPGTAAWNAIVCYIVLREARIRVMGPSAAQEMVSAIFDQGIDPSPEARMTFVRAVASSIVRTEDLHPNLYAVLSEVSKRAPEPIPAGIDDSAAFLQSLQSLRPDEQRMALQVLAAAAIIDGRFTSAERRLIREAQAACGRSGDEKVAERLRRAFISGDGSLDTLIRTSI